jgi:acetylornithine deacetylase
MNVSPVISTLGDLVRINSVNPAYEGGCPESEIAACISQFFLKHGIPTQEQEVFPERPNVIARLPGRQPSQRLIFEAHMDTASVANMTIPPFEPVVEKGRLYGRGSCDTKAGLAAMMHALVSLKKDNMTPPCEIWLVAAADEEYSYRGVVKLCEGLDAAAAVVSEPTELRAVIASKGCVRWRIRTRGKAAHSSKPHLGVNAISHMAKVIVGLEAHSSRLAERKHHLVGSPTCSIGVIHGGVQVNAVPDNCYIEIDRRLIPGETSREALAEYENLLSRLRHQRPPIDVSMEPPMLTDEPLNTPAGAAIVVAASQILKEMGLPAEPVGVPYGSDASKLSRAGVPSIVFGPGDIDQAHAAVEYVECEQVERAVEFYRRLMISFE